MEHSLQCANSSCSKDLLFLCEGRLELVELEPDSYDQVQPDGGAFAMKFLPSKFFRFAVTVRTHTS
jgi:hypothetical protein